MILIRAKDICKNLFWARFNAQDEHRIKEFIEKAEFSIPVPEGLINFLKFLKTKSSQFQAEIKELERQRTEKMAQFKQESKYINEFLKRLCISHFTVDVDVNHGKEGFNIIYKNGAKNKA